mmetsp:Transcript_58887/g.138464  ORF Transcript_58887/g.138464 Transcript_58887/m.138464 type:complete len:87 (-) Transcript_58887:438-698(-)
MAGEVAEVDVRDDDFDLCALEGGSLPDFDEIPLDTPRIIQFYAVGIFFILLLLALIYVSWRHYAPFLNFVKRSDDVKSADRNDGSN